MAVPTTRAEFKAYCLRNLGDGVTRINVSDEQVEDKVDYTLRMWWDYHFDGADKVYFKYELNANNRPDRVPVYDVIASGNGYANGEVVTVSTPDASDGVVAAGTLVTNSNGEITSVTPTAVGSGYRVQPTASITTVAGTGGEVKPVLGGFIPMPDEILGAFNIFPMHNALGINNIFNIRYQIAMNDLYTLTSVTMTPFYMAMTHLQLLEQLLVGQQPLRYNRHKQRLYIDMDWAMASQNGTHVVVEAYEVVNPDVHRKAWGDRWLAEYCTQQIKMTWGEILQKFPNAQMPGRQIANGERIWQQAKDRIELLEQQLQSRYSLPPDMQIG